LVQELEAMKARLKEMEEEAAKLRAMQARRLARRSGDCGAERARRPRWRRR